LLGGESEGEGGEEEEGGWEEHGCGGLILG